MYSTCIFCHSTLGKNDAIEHFPVGRKLAFDGAKGRLWAVCSKCGRWNLTPIEERWEAIEECERQYRGVITRSSTDNIGLGRVKEGTDLIRIGEPLRPEFAAWRYGRFFKRRKQMAYAAHALSYAGSAVSLFSLGVAGTLAIVTASAVVALVRRKNELGTAQRFIKQHAEKGLGKKVWSEPVGIRIISTEDEQGWGLRFALDGKFLDFHGAEALRTAHIVSPMVNIEGGTPDNVRIAVREIEIAGSPQQYFRRILKYGQTKGFRYTNLSQYPEEMALAFEMASHEESERAAIEEDLAQLEADWREAEEIAAIADNMFLPQAITDFVSRHKPGAREN